MGTEKKKQPGNHRDILGRVLVPGDLVVLSPGNTLTIGVYIKPADSDNNIYYYNFIAGNVEKLMNNNLRPSQVMFYSSTYKPGMLKISAATLPFEVMHLYIYLRDIAIKNFTSSDWLMPASETATVPSFITKLLKKNEEDIPVVLSTKNAPKPKTVGIPPVSARITRVDPF